MAMGVPLPPPFALVGWSLIPPSYLIIEYAEDIDATNLPGLNVNLKRLIYTASVVIVFLTRSMAIGVLLPKPIEPVSEGLVGR
jgi:hypothetical protein